MHGRAEGCLSPAHASAVSPSAPSAASTLSTLNHQPSTLNPQPQTLNQAEPKAEPKVDAKDGFTLNLTQSSGSFDRDPAWSPDGKWLAYSSCAGAGSTA